MAGTVFFLQSLLIGIDRSPTIVLVVRVFPVLDISGFFHGVMSARRFTRKESRDGRFFSLFCVYDAQ